MTPKEKAIELIDKFYDYVNPWNDEGEASYGMAEKNAKKCALIAVEEIIVFNPPVDYGMMSPSEYWYAVKKEIELL